MIRAIPRIASNASSLKACVVMAGVGFATTASAIDVIPGQAVAPPPHYNAIMLTHGDYHFGEFYRNGKNLGLNTRIHSQYSAFRYSHSFTLADRPAGWYVEQPWITIEPKGTMSALDKEQGLGDTVFAFAYWLHTDHAAGDYLGLVGYLFLPVGEYDSDRLFNPGQNRHSESVQVVYQKRLMPKWDMMLNADVQVFGKNDDYILTHQTLEQKPIYSGQGTLMYHLTPQLMLAASYFINQGGEERLDGVGQDNKLSQNRWGVAAVKDSSLGRFILQYGQDMNARNGFIEDRHLIIRYQYVWK